jgi:hypothetical protein
MRLLLVRRIDTFRKGVTMFTVPTWAFLVTIVLAIGLAAGTLAAWYDMNRTK